MAFRVFNSSWIMQVAAWSNIDNSRPRPNKKWKCTRQVNNKTTFGREYKNRQRVLYSPFFFQWPYVWIKTHTHNSIVVVGAPPTCAVQQQQQQQLVVLCFLFSSSLFTFLFRRFPFSRQSCRGVSWVPTFLGRTAAAARGLLADSSRTSTSTYKKGSGNVGGPQVSASVGSETVDRFVSSAPPAPPPCLIVHDYYFRSLHPYSSRGRVNSGIRRRKVEFPDILVQVSPGQFSICSASFVLMTSLLMKSLSPAIA